MKFPWTSLAIMAFIALMTTPKLSAYTLLIPTDQNATKSVIKERLQQLDLPFQVNLESTVLDQINQYLTAGYKQTRYMLGRTEMYFPIIEHYLKVHQLPESLKYLPVIESRLKPFAESHVGAVGLWQFMNATAKQYRLSINDYVDERRDPYRATEAAVKMLKQLHKQFDDWALVLAAYNCGPGRVRKAIRLANSKNLEDLQLYLPKETQQYIPRFIAAAYVFNYYKYHGLKPNYVRDLNDVRLVEVYDYLTFKDISFICNLDISTIAYLNPGYRQQIIPQSTRGNLVVLPATALTPFKSFLSGKNYLATIIEDKSSSLRKHIHLVRSGETIGKVAQQFNCQSEEIVKWNNLRAPKLYPNQEIAIYIPDNTLASRP